MKVALDISPISTGHGVRGIGSYTENLRKELSKLKTPLKIDFIGNKNNIATYDLVHYPYFDLFFHTLPIKTKPKRIVTIHDVIPLVFPDKFKTGIKGFINLFLQKRALKNVDFIICDSETSKRDVADKLSVPLSKIRVVYLAAGQQFKPNEKVETFKKVSKKYDLPENFGLYVGDVNWNKNLITLLRAVSLSKVPMIMVGKAIQDDSLEQVKEINNLIMDLKIDMLVKKIGYVPVEDLVSIYNLATVTVVPSYYEGFGLPVLESMACGTPVICSNNSSLAEISGTAALFTNPSDPMDIAKQILAVVNLKASSKKILIKKCLEQAAKFSWEKTAKETSNLYRQVLENKT